MIHQADKKRNPEYSVFDSFLLFTGCPLLFAYILYLIFNPNNIGRPSHDVFSNPMMYGLMIWMAVSYVIYIIRNYRNKQKITQ